MLCCNRSYQKNFDENLKDRFANAYNFCKLDINKSILMLQKSAYRYENIDDWKNFFEAL